MEEHICGSVANIHTDTTWQPQNTCIFCKRCFVLLYITIQAIAAPSTFSFKQVVVVEVFSLSQMHHLNSLEFVFVSLDKTRSTWNRCCTKSTLLHLRQYASSLSLVNNMLSARNVGVVLETPHHSQF